MKINIQSLKKHLKQHPKLINSVLIYNQKIRKIFASCEITTDIKHNTFMFLYDSQTQTLIYPQKLKKYLDDKTNNIERILHDNEYITKIELKPTIHCIKIELDLGTQILTCSRYKLTNIRKKNGKYLDYMWNSDKNDVNTWFIKDHIIKRENYKNKYYDLPITESIDFTNGSDSILYNHPKLEELKSYFKETNNNPLIRDFNLKVSLTYSDILKINEPRTLLLTTKYKRLRPLKSFIAFPNMTIFELLMFGKLYYKVSKNDFKQIIIDFQQNKQSFYDDIYVVLNTFNNIRMDQKATNSYKLLLIWFINIYKTKNKPFSSMSNIISNNISNARTIDMYLNLYTKLYPKKTIDLNIKNNKDLNNKTSDLLFKDAIYSELKYLKIKTNKSLYIDNHKNLLHTINKNKHFTVIKTPNQLLKLNNLIKFEPDWIINIIKMIKRKNQTRILTKTTDNQYVVVISQSQKTQKIKIDKVLNLYNNDDAPDYQKLNSYLT